MGDNIGKNKYGETWQNDYITLTQACQSKYCLLTMVETTTKWLETLCLLPPSRTLSWDLKSQS